MAEGSTFVSKSAAAKALGVSLRSVYRLVDGGKLRASHTGRNSGVNAEDLARLVADRTKRDSTLPVTLSRAFAGEILARMTRFEQRVNTLEQILDIRREDLELSDAELMTLHRAAQESLDTDWMAPMEETWGGVFIRLQIEQFEKLEAMLRDKHPWVVFYRLSIRMAQKPKFDFHRDLLIAGRNHLRDAAILWCVTRGETAAGANMLLRTAEG